MNSGASDKLYIVLISIHGLIRGEEPELGRDADTGGQVRYVLDLARALAKSPRVERVDLLTRQVLSLNLGHDYAEHIEELGEGAQIVRLPCGPHRYLRKESLWPYLDEFAEHALRHFREVGQMPDVIHGHYADAGDLGARLAELLDVPLVFTGHSLGRIKRERLAAKGMSDKKMVERYKIGRRIAAEERALKAADLVVASTTQEIEEQYAKYKNRVKKRMTVIPPGIHLDEFRPPERKEPRPAIADDIERFLADPGKPWILALQRPDERKNLGTLITAFGEHEASRDAANLVLVIGTRDDIGELPAGQRRVLDEMLHLIDRHDLYGSVAYPKRHEPDDVPALYRWAAYRHGVFVNPALTEPFGLTLIEAAASGLPVVATNDGGPQSIIKACRNGRLVDPESPEDIAQALHDVLSDPKGWKRKARSGARGAKQHFSWPGHAEKYLESLDRVFSSSSRRPRQRLIHGRRLLVCDIDNTLTGDAKALASLVDTISEHRDETLFAVATGRTVESALAVLEDHGVGRPDVVISAVGSEIHFTEGQTLEDQSWVRHIDYHWRPRRIREVFDRVPGLKLQARSEQRAHKISYDVDPEKFPSRRDLKSLIKSHHLDLKMVYSHNAYLDLVPRRAGKGAAVQHVAQRFGLPLDHVVVAGDSGNDRDMLQLDAPAIVVGNRAAELANLKDSPTVYFAAQSHAAGVAEGLRHFAFFDL